MRTKVIALLLSAAAVAAAGAAVRADDDHDSPRLPDNATFTTLTVTDLAIEGLTGDAFGNLYTTGRATAPDKCPVWKISATGPSSPPHPIVGFIPNNPAPNACNPAGITFDGAGNLYVSDGGNNRIVEIPAGGGSQITAPSRIKEVLSDEYPEFSQNVESHAWNSRYIRGSWQALIIGAP